MGHRHRQSVQPRRDGDGGYRLGPPPRHQFGPLRQLHPDRRTPLIAAIPAARCSILNGEVIGINTAIISPLGGSIGIGFAIPSNSCHRRSSISSSEFGEVRRGWLGVRIQEVTDDTRRKPRHRAGARCAARRRRRQGTGQAGGLEPGYVVITVRRPRRSRRCATCRASSPTRRSVNRPTSSSSARARKRRYRSRWAGLRTPKRLLPIDPKKDAAPEQKSIVQKTLGVGTVGLDVGRSAQEIQVSGTRSKASLVTGVDLGVGAMCKPISVSGPATRSSRCNIEAVGTPPSCRSESMTLKAQGKKVAVSAVSNGNGDAIRGAEFAVR